jgi:hypothetical protein
MIQEFFPAVLKYNDESIRDNKDKKFWKKAVNVCKIRTLAEETRRAEARNFQGL